MIEMKQEDKNWTYISIVMWLMFGVGVIIGWKVL